MERMARAYGGSFTVRFGKDRLEARLEVPAGA
jgi:hypothetical protein